MDSSIKILPLSSKEKIFSIDACCGIIIRWMPDQQWQCMALLCGVQQTFFTIQASFDSRYYYWFMNIPTVVVSSSIRFYYNLIDIIIFGFSVVICKNDAGKENVEWPFSRYSSMSRNRQHYKHLMIFAEPLFYLKLTEGKNMHAYTHTDVLRILVCSCISVVLSGALSKWFLEQAMWYNNSCFQSTRVELMAYNLSKYPHHQYVFSKLIVSSAV